MKKIILAVIFAFLFIGVLTANAASVNLNWVYDTVAQTFQPAVNAVNARIMGSSFHATSTATSSTFTILNDTWYADYLPSSYSDIGAKVMAAYAAMPAEGGKIVITASSTFSTPMLFTTPNKHVLLECDPGVVLNYTGTGSSTVFATFVYPDYPSDAGINGCTFDGPGGSTVVGVSLGNSAGGAAGYNFRNFVVKDFGYGVVSGANTYLTSFDNFKLENNNRALYVYGANNSGENLRFSNGLIGDCKTIANCVYFATSSSASTLWEGMSMDNAQLTIASSNFNFSIVGGHCENPAAQSQVIGKYACIVNNGETTGINGLSVVNMATSSAQTPDAFIINTGYLNIFSASVWSANSISAPAFVSNSSAATVNIYGINELGTSIDTIATSSVGFYIADNRNVGIGTSSPAGLLDVNGDAYFGSSTGTTSLNLRAGSGRNAVFGQEGASSVSAAFINSNGSIDFRTDGASKMFITDVGLVGIGTTNPGTLLTVAGTTTLATTTIASSTIGTLNLTNALSLAMGGTGATTAAGARTNLGATTIGSNIFTLTNPSSSTLLRLNANNTVSAISTSTLNIDLLNTVGTLGATRGGTGLTSYATGDLIYASGANTLANRAIGSTGNVLSVVGGVPTWVSTSSLNIAGGGGFADPLTTNGDIIARIGGATTRLAQGGNGTFLGVSGGVLGYYTPAGSGTINSGTTGQLARYDGSGTTISGTSTITVADNGTILMGSPSISPNIAAVIEENVPAGYSTVAIRNTAADGRAQLTFSNGLGSNYYDCFVGSSGSSTLNYPNTMEVGCGFAGSGINFWSDGFLQARMATSGNLGLGTTTNLLSKLSVQTDNNNPGSSLFTGYDSTGAPTSIITNNGTFNSNGGYRTPFSGVGYAVTSGNATTSSVIMDFFAASSQAVMRGYESNGIGFRTGAGTPVERLRILQDGQVNIGTSTATGTLAVQGLTPVSRIAQFFNSIGSSTMEVTSATSSLTHNSTLVGFANEVLARVTIGIDSVLGYYRSGKNFAALTISGLFYQQDWNQVDCSAPVGATQIAADGLTGCDGFAFYEDGTETMISGTQGGLVYARLSTSLTAGGAGVFVNAPSTGAFIFGTSTPKLEVVARLHTMQNWATSTRAYIGFTNIAAAGTTYEIEPTVGCYFTASSSASNWLAVCRTSAVAQTVVDTGVASTTAAGTGDGRPYRFFLEADSLEARFYIQSTEAGNLTQVAGITTNVPTTVALNAGAHFGSPTGIVARGIDIYGMNFGWRKALR